MAKYQRPSGVRGKWVRGSEVISGTRCKLVSETTPTPSQFKNKDGSVKMQDVARIRFENNDEPMNININMASIGALVEAFGEDSKDWINKYLTAVTEKMIVGGKRVTGVYLIPDGYELKDGLDGYMQVSKIGEEPTTEPEVINLDEEPGQDESLIPF